MGEVYKAFDPSLDRTVALKTIRADADSPSFLDRLYREAKACGRLHHPRIVTVHDLGEVDGVVFIAMEFLEGENLGATMARGDLGFETKLNILIQILDALQYAHAEGVIHRDIKPANVHVLPDRSVKLLDFGLARVTRAESLTMSGAIMGTPYYMSPEQLKGQHVDGRTDVYSTGVLAYELFTRRRAFEGDTITTVMLKVLSEPPPPMHTAWSAAFPEIERIVTRAIAKPVEERYANAEDMKNALTAFLASSHAAISKAQADVTIQSNRAIEEAKTLIQKGEAAQSEKLLAETIRLNPDANEARKLWDQVTQVSPPAPAPVKPVTPPAPVQQTVVAPPPAPALRPVQPAHPPAPVVAGPERAAPAPLKPPAPAPTPKPRPRSLLIGIVVAACVILGVGIVALVTGQRASAPGQPPATTPPAASATSPAAATTPAAVQTPPAAAPATPPVAAPTQAAQPPSTAAQAPGPTPVPARSGSGGGARANPAAQAVFIDSSGADTSLTAALNTALSTRGVSVQSTAAGAKLTVRPRIQVTVRPSPFQNNSALTADYTGTLEITSPGGARARQTVPVDGHVLDFGEAVVKAAAIRAAADQMAEAIEKAVRE